MVSDPDGVVELAVLHTLGHLGYATTEHLHALCFGDAASSTVRLRLAALRAAGCIELTPWRLPRVCQERGSVWTLSATGCAYLASYGVQIASPPERTLGVPSTALERDAWRVRMTVRSLIVRLIVQARVLPTFADVRVQVGSWWPTPYAPPPIHGDAELTIVWTPETVHEATWLPWRAGTPLHSGATRYLLMVDRALAATVPETVMQQALHSAQRADATAVIIWETDERLALALRARAVNNARTRSIRMTTHALIERDLAGAHWRDAYGRHCSLRPQAEELLSYHAPASA